MKIRVFPITPRCPNCDGKLDFVIERETFEVGSTDGWTRRESGPRVTVYFVCGRRIHSECRGVRIQAAFNIINPKRKMNYWECECCGHVHVTNLQDSAKEYQCPQCARAKCDHGGKYRRIGIDRFLEKCGIA